MSGLSLIKEYSSDSEDEELSLKNEENRKYNSENRLPLPQSITTWKGVDYHTEVTDDPSQHEGRTRSFKHERGNWATLVYILYKPSETLRSWMNSIRTQNSLKDGKLFDEFHVELRDVKVYCNDDKTRTFLGICCESNGALDDITEALNKLLNEYQLPPFYKEASHHISFLWSLDDHEKQFNALIPSLSSSLRKFLSENPEEKYVHVNKLHCKVGNRLYTFNLR